MNSKTTYCPLPFNHLHVTSNGDVKPCCVSKPFKTRVNVNAQNLEEIYNNDNFRRIRKSLLTNKRPSECAVCWEQEASGIQSHRIKLVKEVPIHPKTELVDLNFDYIDIRFSNLCNLKCVMCNGGSSHLLNGGKVLEVNYDFIQALKPKLHYLRKVYFAGGEPLIMDQHYEILEYLSNTNNSVLLNYNTNLQVLEKGKYKVIDLWKKFKHKPIISASCDGLYELGSKIRVNFNTNKFITNILKLKENKITYNIFYTVGNYNIKNIPTFLQQVTELGLIDDIERDVTFENFIQAPYKHSISNMTEKDKAETEELLNSVPTHRNQLETLIMFMQGKKSNL